MDYKKQVQKHNSKVWDILMLSAYNKHWLHGLSQISKSLPGTSY